MSVMGPARTTALAPPRVHARCLDDGALVLSSPQALQPFARCLGDVLDMEIQEWFKGYQAEQRKVRDDARKLGLDEGKQLGLDEGKQLALARRFEKRLGRTRTDEERSTLAGRFTRLREDRLDEVVLTLAGGPLAAWLADPAGR